MNPHNAARRSFLKKGIIGGIAFAGLACAGGLALWPTRRVLAPRRALRVLDDTEFSILAEIASVTAPTAEPIELCHRIDEFALGMSPASQRDLCRLLHLVESGLIGALFDARARPFSHLSNEGKIAALTAMRDSLLTIRRCGYQALRRLTVSTHFAHPDNWAAIGYGGPPTLVMPT